MADTTKIWPCRCKCGQVVGDVAEKFAQLLLDGVPAHAAASKFGLSDLCCLNSLQTPTEYPLKQAHTGHIDEGILRTTQPIEIFSLRQDCMAQSGITLSTSSQVISSSSSTTENIYKSIKGIPEPGASVKYNPKNLKRGEVVVTGFSRDDNGDPIMVPVGSGKYVPVLSYIIKL